MTMYNFEEQYVVHWLFTVHSVHSDAALFSYCPSTVEYYIHRSCRMFIFFFLVNAKGFRSATTKKMIDQRNTGTEAREKGTKQRKIERERDREKCKNNSE